MRVVAYIINVLCWVSFIPITNYFGSADTRFDYNVSGIIMFVWFILTIVSMCMLINKED